MGIFEVGKTNNCLHVGVCQRSSAFKVKKISEREIIKDGEPNYGCKAME